MHSILFVPFDISWQIALARMMSIAYIVRDKAEILYLLIRFYLGVPELFIAWHAMYPVVSSFLYLRFICVYPKMKFFEVA